MLTRARNAMRDTLLSAWSKRAETVELREPYEALILASIVEKETGIASERSGK